MAKNKDLLTVGDIQGAWAIMPTPAKEGSQDWRMDNTVDVDESARVVDELVKSGVQGILTMGTLGECSTMTWDEKQSFMGAVIDSVNGRVPLFVGTTTMNTRDTIYQTKVASDMGADGTMLGIPMWCTPTMSVAVQFYKDVAEACPDMAICIYANNQAFKFGFPPPFWAQVAPIPQVVTAKYAGIGSLVMDLNLTRGQIKFLPIDFDYYGAARVAPEFINAFWSSGAVCGPSVVTKLRDTVAAAKASGDWTEAKKVSDDIAGTFATFFPQGGLEEFGMLNIGLEKERMNAAGWMKAGPMRPPYHALDDAKLEGGRIAGRKWAELHQKYSA